MQAVHPGELPAISATRRLVRGWVAATGLDEDTADSVVLAVDEAVTNAVEHAAQDRPCRVRVVLGPRACGGGVAVLVADDGVWQPPGDPGHRGRGLQLMSELATRSTIDTDSRGTTVRLCWSIDPR